MGHLCEGRPETPEGAGGGGAGLEGRISAPKRRSQSRPAPAGRLNRRVGACFTAVTDRNDSAFIRSQARKWAGSAGKGLTRPAMLRPRSAAATEARLSALRGDLAGRVAGGIHEQLLGGESGPTMRDLRLWDDRTGHLVHERQTRAARATGLSNRRCWVDSGNAGGGIRVLGEREADHGTACRGWSDRPCAKRDAVHRAQPHQGQPVALCTTSP